MVVVVSWLSGSDFCCFWLLLLFSWQQAAELVRVHNYHYYHTDAASHADAAGGSAVFCLLPQGGGGGGGYIYLVFMVINYFALRQCIVHDSVRHKSNMSLVPPKSLSYHLLFVFLIRVAAKSRRARSCCTTTPPL